MAVTVEQAERVIRAGGIVAYPTETLYGLACKLEGAPIARLKRLKGRDARKPILIAVPDVRSIGRYAAVPKRIIPFLKAVMPGPVAVVLDRRKGRVSASLTGGRRGVGIRVPDDPIARRLAREFGAITSTSANISGRAPSRTSRDVERSGLDLFTIIPGKCKYGRPSTLFDARTGRVVREGAVPAEKVYRLWKELAGR